ncbi:MAG TPA: VOC family protein [Verrucomicrobiales bacterium]|nr:VOC family protein [Verrucomicrobiales bacterium]
MRIGSIVINCFEFKRMITFWQEALKYTPREADSNDLAILRDPTEKGPNLSFQARDRRAGHRSWFHLDLYTNSQEEEVERLIGLGARRYPWRYPEGADYVVLEAPDGNLFCVVEVPDKE